MSAATMTTYDVPSSLIRDVDGVIRNIDPTDTPFQSAIGSGKAKQKKFEWIEEVLPTPNVNNAQVEGFDAPEAVQDEVTYRDNVVQTFSRTARVTGFLEDADLYGRKSEMARQMRLNATVLKIEVEKNLVGVASRNYTVGDKTTGRKFANAFYMIDSSMVSGNSGTPRALDEATVLTASQNLYNAGVKAEILMIKPSDHLVVANFAYATNKRYRELDGDTKKITNTVDFYESPFMNLKVQKNRHLLSSKAILFDPDMWELVWYRSWKTRDLPSTGDWMAKFIYGDCAPKHKHFKATALIDDLS